MSPIKRILHDKRHPIVYFCAEYAVEDDLPIYAGGLGILSADLIRQASDDHIPWISIGLFYQRGFAIFTNPEKNHRAPIDPKLSGFTLLLDERHQPLHIPIEVYDRVIQTRVWHRNYGTAQLYLLDTNTELNSLEDRMITEFLYDERFEKRLLQEVTLGVGGVKLLRKLGITPRIYHLNEGHTSFAIVALALEEMHDHPETKTFTDALKAVKKKIVATKHTILPGAGLYFTNEQFKRVISAYFERHHANFDEFFNLGRGDDPVIFSTTKFLIEGSVRSSAVSKLHAFFEKERYPHSPLIPITNGIYEPRWMSEQWKKREDNMSDAELWRIHNDLKSDLLQYVYERTRIELNPEALTVVWARRFAQYKRPELLFNDFKRLINLTHANTPVQFIIAGQAHQGDLEGNELIERIIAYTKSEEFGKKIVYLPDYSLRVARVLVRGADVWLNTPERGKEACGTSGMKSALNGALQFSVQDGWVAELDWNDKGWVLPETDIEQRLYDILERDIIPAFYTRNEQGIPLQWTSRMRSTMRAVANEFSLKRTLKDYFEKLYPDSL